MSLVQAVPGVLRVSTFCAAMLLAAATSVGQSYAGDSPKAPGGSIHGVLVNSQGSPVYGFSNIRVTNWLGIQVLHANFVSFDGVQRPIGNVTLIPTSTPGVFVWTSDQGPSGIIQANGQAVGWRDATGGSGKYIPL